jgi:hypothetical protein
MEKCGPLIEAMEARMSTNLQAAKRRTGRRFVHLGFGVFSPGVFGAALLFGSSGR